MNVDLVRQRWLALDVPVRAGLPDSELDAFEKRYGVRLPEDVRQFYRFMDGMEYGCTDEALYCFWPLSEVGTVPEKLSGCHGIPDYGGIENSLPDANSYFVFADHSIWLQVYALRLSADPIRSGSIVLIRDGQTWANMAPSFGEFVKRYTADPWSVL